MDQIIKREYTAYEIAQAYLVGQKVNTLKNYRQAVRHLLTFLHQSEIFTPLSFELLLKVDLLTAKAFAISCLTRVEPSTLGVYISGLVGLYDLYVYHNLVPFNVFKHPLIAIKGSARKPKSPTPKLSPSQVTTLLTHYKPDNLAHKRARCILALLLGGGLRRQEVVNLKLGDIMPPAYCRNFVTLKLYYTKGGVYEEQSLPSWAGDWVMDWCGDRCLSGGHHNDPLIDLSLEGLHKAWRKICADCGIFGKGIHSCRVTAINKLLDAGYAPVEVQRFARHKHVNTTMGYQRMDKNAETNVGRDLDYRS